MTFNNKNDSSGFSNIQQGSNKDVGQNEDISVSGINTYNKKPQSATNQNDISNIYGEEENIEENND
jgi:hypothetical protein